MRVISLVVVVGALLFAAESRAAVYRCLNEYGIASFSQQPCGPDAREVDLGRAGGAKSSNGNRAAKEPVGGGFGGAPSSASTPKSVPSGAVVVNLLGDPAELKGLRWPVGKDRRPERRFYDTTSRMFAVRLPNGSQVAIPSSYTHLDQWYGWISKISLRPGGRGEYSCSQVVSTVGRTLSELGGRFDNSDAKRWKGFATRTVKSFRARVELGEWIELAISARREKSGQCDFELSVGASDEGVEGSPLPGGARQLQASGANTIPYPVAFSPDSRRLAVGFKLFDPVSGGLAATVEAPGRPGSVAFSPDGRWIAYGVGSDKTLLVDAATLAVVRELHHEPPQGVRRGSVIGFSPDSSKLYTSAETILEWMVEGEGPPRRFNVPERAPAAAAISPDGRWIATSTEFKYEVSLWSVDSGQVSRMLKPDSDHEAVRPEHLVFSADGGRLFGSGFMGARINVWNLANRVYGGLRADSHQEAALSPDGRWLAYGTWNTMLSPNALFIIDANSGGLRAAVRPLAGVWSHTRWSPDGRWIVIVGNGGRALLLNAERLLADS